MQARIKTAQEIELMRVGGKKLAEVMRKLKKFSRAGVSTAEIDHLAEKLILKAGGQPSFKGYGEPDPFPATICASINDEIVHGIPSPKRILKKGDVFKIDIGMKFKGLHTDMARTFLIGGERNDKKYREKKKIIKTVEETFFAGISALRVGRKLYEYSLSAGKFAERNGFSVVRNLVGHGIGKELHEFPQIPNIGKISECDFVLRSGMTFALEPMINAGVADNILAKDGWTFKTADGKLSAHWENTILITKNGAEILTK